jgi:hypothetical protein
MEPSTGVGGVDRTHLLIHRVAVVDGNGDRVPRGQHVVKDDRNRRNQTELLRRPEVGLNCEDAGQSVARAFLDTEEV